MSRLHHGRGRARLTSRLVASDTEQQLWAGSYDVDLSDPLSAQEELSATIASIVHQSTIRSELERIVWKHTSELGAWELVMLGQQDLKKLTPTGNASARRNFCAALQIDPDYTAAHVGVATSYCWDVPHVEKQSWPDLLTLAEAAAKRALQSDWNSPLAHTRLGAVYIWREDFERGLAETELALHLNPSDAGSRLALGNRLDLIGQSAIGIAHMEKGVKLNPLDPESARYLGYLSRAYLFEGKPDRATDYAIKGIALRPNDPEMHYRLAACAASLGDPTAAQSALDDCEKIEPGFLSRKRDWAPYKDRDRNDAVLGGLRRYELI